MNIVEHVKKSNKSNNKTFSIEILPPRNGESVDEVYRVIEEFLGMGVDFVSVTHGSGGSLRGGTEALGALLHERYGVEPLIHLTCLDQSKEMIENKLMVLKYLKLNNILALRGDPPWGVEDFESHPQGHKYALDLIKQIVEVNKGHYLLRSSDKQMYKLEEGASYRAGEESDFVIWGACYPEGHVDGSTVDEEVDYAVEKLRAGASGLITQMIFDVNLYKTFVDRVLCGCPGAIILPGVMPLVRSKQVGFVKRMFGASVPENYIQVLSGDDSHSNGLKQCARLCNELLEAGAPGIHFFTMNESEDIRKVINMVKNDLCKVEQ